MGEFGLGEIFKCMARACREWRRWTERFDFFHPLFSASVVAFYGKNSGHFNQGYYPSILRTILGYRRPHLEAEESLGSSERGYIGEADGGAGRARIGGDIVPNDEI